MIQSPTPALEIRATAYYSNGGYGRTWGVRQVLDCFVADAGGEVVVRFKGIAGTCRRKTGECSLAEFRRWARHEVALNENSWHRIGYLEDDFPDTDA